MNFSSKLLQDAVDEISRLPGIGKNTATRLALNLIKEKDENVMKLIAAIKSLKNGILFVSNAVICLISQYVESVVMIKETHQYYASLRTSEM